VLILPETDAAAALHVAERCKNMLAKLQIPHETATVDGVITASMGVGTFHPSGETEPKHFVEVMDKLLYQAKQNGRNRIEFASL
jgi:diguanylate cyclase (GGDEF)-like protein